MPCSIAIVVLVILGCVLHQENVGAVDPRDASKKQDAQAESISPGFKDRRADNPQDAAKQTDDQNARIANYTLLLAMLTAILAAAGLAQVVISRGTARRQLRAYVVVQKATITVAVQATGSERTVTARVTFLNAGQTPAYKLEHRRSIRLDGFHLRPVFPEASRFMRTMAVLGPNIEHPDDLGIGVDLTDEDWSGLKSGALAVYFWGEVAYRDIFKKKRYTRFAVRYPRIISKVEDTSTTACPDGNDAS